MTFRHRQNSHLCGNRIESYSETDVVEMNVRGLYDSFLTLEGIFCRLHRRILLSYLLSQSFRRCYSKTKPILFPLLNGRIVYLLSSFTPSTFNHSRRTRLHFFPVRHRNLLLIFSYLVIAVHLPILLDFHIINMSKEVDTIGTVNVETWDATNHGLLSYVKTPIQTTFFVNNSDLIGKALRQAIIYFANTLVTADQRTCVLGNEFRSTRTHRYHLPPPADGKTSEMTLMEITTYAPIAFDYIRSIIGISRNEFLSSFSDRELLNFTNTGRSGSQMYKTPDDVSLFSDILSISSGKI